MAFFKKTSAQTSNTNNFATRAEAFAYMLAYQLDEKNADPLVAAQKANEFADIYAKNLSLPNNMEPKPEGIDYYLQMIDKVSNYCDKHPKVTELLLGAVSFVGGLVVSKNNNNETYSPQTNNEPIDFDSVE